MPKKTKTATETRPSIPMPARVQEDADFRPVAVSLEGKYIRVVSIDGRVEEEGEWWEPEPVFKMHYQVLLEDGATRRSAPDPTARSPRPLTRRPRFTILDQPNIRIRIDELSR